MKNNRISGKMMTVRTATLLAALTVFVHCTHDPIAPPLPDQVSFSMHILPLFRQHCSIPDCHSGGSPTAHLNLGDAVAYDQLFAKHEIDTLAPTQSLLYRQMNSSGTPMPPTGKLGDYDVSLVLKWISQGAKRN
jgi:hypothetical protein